MNRLIGLSLSLALLFTGCAEPANDVPADAAPPATGVTIMTFNVENLFDTEYFPNAHSTHQVTVGRPINAGFSIRGTFK